MKEETRVELTWLRKDQNYTKYYTFLTRLVITGIFPILALLFFNINIYLVSCKQSRKGIWNYYKTKIFFKGTESFAEKEKSADANTQQVNCLNLDKQPTDVFLI